MKSTAIKRRNNGFSSYVPQSTMRIRTAKDKSDIYKIAQLRNIDYKKVAERILQMSQDELIKYIQSKGEVPVNTWEGRSIQAALLRMEDVSVISGSMNMTEDQALAHIEEAETDAVQNNTAAKSAILTPSTQAALSCVIDYILSEMKKRAGSSGITDSLDKIRMSLATPKNHNISASSVASNFDGSDGTDQTGDFADDPDLSPVSITTQIQPTGGSSPISISAAAGPAPSSNPSETVTSDGSIWSNISSLAGAIGAIGNTITGTANSLGNTVNNLGGQIGANAISTYLSQNWAYLVAGIIGIAIIIIFMTRAAQN